jgi:spermidine synthase
VKGSPVSPEVLDRVTTPRGELVLRRVDGEFEVISNGTFLMDTRDGRSERALVRAALAAHRRPAAARTLVVGGLGVGFSLLEAVSDPDLERVVVVEIEPVLVSWHATQLAHLTGAALADPRVQVVVGDVAAHLAEHPGGYDVVCLDVDNGPDWTVTETNDALYSADGLDRCVQALASAGVLAVWSARPAPRYADLLAGRLDDVQVIEVETSLGRGDPDVVFTGVRRPGLSPATP